MNEALRGLKNNLLESGKDLLPIVLVIAFFQIAVLQRPIPDFSLGDWDPLVTTPTFSEAEKIS